MEEKSRKKSHGFPINSLRRRLRTVGDLFDSVHQIYGTDLRISLRPLALFVNKTTIHQTKIKSLIQSGVPERGPIDSRTYTLWVADRARYGPHTAATTNHTAHRSQH